MKKKNKVISLIVVLSLCFSFTVIPSNAVSPYAVVLPDPDLGGGTDYSGTYLIKNCHFDRFITIDNNVSDSTSSAHMELWSLSGGIDQKWQISYVSDGYYKIISVASGLALSVPAGCSYTGGAGIQQEAYTGAARQLWSITLTDNNTFVLRPNSGSNDPTGTDWCLCASGSSGDGDGRNVEQWGYSDNSVYIDEWELIKFIDSSFVSIPDENHDHDGSFPSILTSLSQMSFSTNRTSYSLDKYTCAAYISSSEIFYSRSHGSKSSIQLNDDSMTISTLNSFDNMAFSNCRLVLYGACSTGSGGSGSDNLVNKTYDKGAQTVIGFQITVYCNEVNMWATAFFDALSSGATVENACHAADTYVQNNWNYTISTNSWYIAGSRTQTF